MTYESAFEDPYTALEELTVMLDDLFAILSESMHLPGSSFPAQAQVDPFRPFAVLLAGTPISCAGQISPGSSIAHKELYLAQMRFSYKPLLGL